MGDLDRLGICIGVLVLFITGAGESWDSMKTSEGSDRGDLGKFSVLCRRKLDTNATPFIELKPSSRKRLGRYDVPTV